MKYKASLGLSAIIVTVIVGVLFASLSGFLLYKAISANGIIESITATIFALLLIGSFAFMYLYRTLSYSLNNESITIIRPIKNVVIPITDIKNAFIIRKESMQWTERIGGNGGIFGYYGEFKNGFGYMK